jgi:3-oxoacyl-[acyl-carrier-protein] synthase-3
MNSKIQHIEYYLPKTYETLKDLKKQNPSWDIKKIYKTTGINKRYIASAENIVDMAEKSCRKLIKKNKIKDIDFLILVTQSSPTGVPTSANILHKKLNLSQKCLCFDINQGCSGFIYALGVATSLIQSNFGKSGIIVCSEKYSQYIEKDDSSCRPIFSDGSSSVFIKKNKRSKINSFVLGSDGSGYKNLIVPSKNIKIRDKILKKNKIYMDGSKVFLFTLNKVQECFYDVLRKSNLKKNEIDYFIFHQASKFIIDNIVRKLGIDKKKNIINLNQIGNTVSSSIPIALKMALKKKKIKKKSKVLLLGFGVGYSWGGCIIEC